MRVLRILAVTEADGMIRLRFPGGKPGEMFDTAIVMSVPAPPGPQPTPEELGWPPGYLESTYGSIDDETFEAPSRNRPEPPEPIG